MITYRPLAHGLRRAGGELEWLIVRSSVPSSIARENEMGFFKAMNSAGTTDASGSGTADPQGLEPKSWRFRMRAKEDDEPQYEKHRIYSSLAD
jgi:hypothetical protein